MENLSSLGWVPSLSVLTFGSFAMIATQGGIGAYQLAVQKNIDALRNQCSKWLGLWLAALACSNTYLIYCWATVDHDNVYVE